jgi:hypothetical protein
MYLYMCWLREGGIESIGDAGEVFVPKIKLRERERERVCAFVCEGVREMAVCATCNVRI